MDKEAEKRVRSAGMSEKHETITEISKKIKDSEKKDASSNKEK